MPGPAKHFDGIETDEATLPRIGYDPEPPLDIDPSPIDGDDLRAWRERQYSDEGITSYPSTDDIVKPLPVHSSTWSGWERRGVPHPCWRAFLREWIREGRPPVSVDAVDPGKVRAVVAVVGGYHDVAEQLGVYYTTVSRWGSDKSERNATSHTGSGPLFGWLADDMSLEPIDKIPKQVAFNTKLSVRQVREIRRRREAGETPTEMATDYPVAVETVQQASRGDSYQWVD